jgi:TonB family protein
MQTSHFALGACLAVAVSAAVRAAPAPQIDPDDSRVTGLVLYSPGAQENARSLRFAPPEMRVLCTISADGKVAATEVIRSTGRTKLDAACIALLKREKFPVKKVDGKATEYQETLTLTPVMAASQ